MMLQGDWEEYIWMRDPAVCYYNGSYHCFYTHIDSKRALQEGITLSLARIISNDLRNFIRFSVRIFQSGQLYLE